MIKVALEAPWYTFRKKLNALFERDPEIIVSEIYQPDGTCDYALDIVVRNHKKFLALDRVLPGVKSFGGVTLGIHLYDEENNTEDNIALYEAIFDGNPIVEEITRTVDFAGVEHGYVQFRPEVLQFHDDDISDYHGNWSGLAQDIAREVFEQDFRGVHFCTAPVQTAVDSKDDEDKPDEKPKDELSWE